MSIGWDNVCRGKCLWCLECQGTGQHSLYPSRQHIVNNNVQIKIFNTVIRLWPISDLPTGKFPHPACHYCTVKHDQFDNHCPRPSLLIITGIKLWPISDLPVSKLPHPASHYYTEKHYNFNDHCPRPSLLIITWIQLWPISYLPIGQFPHLAFWWSLSKTLPVDHYLDSTLTNILPPYWSISTSCILMIIVQDPPCWSLPGFNSY
jgi:hypothetical protein